MGHAFFSNAFLSNAFLSTRRTAHSEFSIAGGTASSFRHLYVLGALVRFSCRTVLLSYGGDARIPVQDNDFWIERTSDG